MTVHWMMNNPWPSLFGHLFDYYFKQGGGYFGREKGAASADCRVGHYATGDRSSAKSTWPNQTGSLART